MMLAKPRTSPTARTASAAVMARQAKPVRRWSRGEEPPIADLLADPILQRLLARDRIATDQLLTLIAEMRGKLIARTCSATP